MKIAFRECKERGELNVFETSRQSDVSQSREEVTLRPGIMFTSFYSSLLLYYITSRTFLELFCFIVTIHFLICLVYKLNCIMGTYVQQKAKHPLGTLQCISVVPGGSLLPVGLLTHWLMSVAHRVRTSAKHSRKNLSMPTLPRSFMLVSFQFLYNVKIV